MTDAILQSVKHPISYALLHVINYIYQIWNHPNISCVQNHMFVYGSKRVLCACDLICCEEEEEEEKNTGKHAYMYLWLWIEGRKKKTNISPTQLSHIDWSENTIIRSKCQFVSKNNVNLVNFYFMLRIGEYRIQNTVCCILCAG